ncbi:MAG TPA: phosphoribosyltransferase family protein [Egibacteraceae bacterium]|nr:phosphoribosyltransferase family protein [Egibacteraceae bacterium]
MQVFRNRTEAGRQLAEALRSSPLVGADERIVILAIPRGGLPIGVEVARALGAPLDVAVVRKLRSPQNPELGFGAVGAHGLLQIDKGIVARLGLTREEIDAEIADRREALERRLVMYRAVAPPVDIAGATAVVVDDGVATGGTARQACALARQAGAARVVLAAPVGPPGADKELADAADDVVILSQPAEFMAVGQAYQDFEQIDDAAALSALRAAAGVT